MIKFFRHIRQKLLSDLSSEASAKGGNKFSKYLLYALGEIILVVIGILIALWINATYYNYTETQVETSILKKLLVDIESDYIQLQTADSTNQNILIEIKAFKNAIVQNDEVVVKRMISERYSGAQFLDINPRSTTFDEMINSGKLYTLSNTELTDLCIDYYESIDKYSTSLLQIRNEYRALFYGPEMTEYWLIFLEEIKNKNASIDDFMAKKEAKVYKTLKQCAGWGEIIMRDTDKRIKEIKQANRMLYENISKEIRIND